MEAAVHRPAVFDKMERLVREMQDPETGVPVRSQKVFLTSIPSAFMGYDLIEWLLERLNVEDAAEALHLANLLCQYGYFFPVGESRGLQVKDDSSLYRFQTPYYWPSQSPGPDNLEYAVYLCKRSLRGRQRHGLEDYELEALASLKKTLSHKWDFVTMQAEEQLRLARDRKKAERLVSESQERAFWKVVRPPPGSLGALDSAPVPPRIRTSKSRRNVDDLRKDRDFLSGCLDRNRLRVSQVDELLVQRIETYSEFDPFMCLAQPSNPWISDDPSYWIINSPIVEIPTEKRVKRWSLSIEDVVSDPTGIHEFTNYLRKEYSHENIRFWLSVAELRRGPSSAVPIKVQEIFEEFLAPGAPCEINIDGRTMEQVHAALARPNRYAFDSAAEHVFSLLLKKDCYPRFVRSEHYRNLVAASKQTLQKKRFFNFGAAGRRKTPATTTPNSLATTAPPRRRGSDISGSSHDLAFPGIRPDVPYREARTPAIDVCPWEQADTSDADTSTKNETSQDESPEPTLKRAQQPSVTSTSTQPEASSSEAGPANTLNIGDVGESTSDSGDEPQPGTSETAGGDLLVDVVIPDSSSVGATAKVAEVDQPMEAGTKEQLPSTSNLQKQDSTEWSGDDEKEQPQTRQQTDAGEGASDKRKSRRSSKGRRQSSKTPPDAAAAPIAEVCPWEDEENCKVETPFVKTYATLGYL